MAQNNLLGRVTSKTQSAEVTSTCEVSIVPLVLYHLMFPFIIVTFPPIQIGNQDPEKQNWNIVTERRLDILVWSSLIKPMLSF